MARLLLIFRRMEMDARNKNAFFETSCTNVIKPLEPNISVTCFSSLFTCRAGLLELEGRTRRATDAVIPELNVNGSTSVDFKTNGNGCSK